MVGHQTIGPNRKPCLACLRGQQISINFLIAGLEEDWLAAVAALSDVVGEARNNDARDARHGCGEWEGAESVRTNIERLLAKVKSVERKSPGLLEFAEISIMSPYSAHHPVDAHPSVSGEFLMRVGFGGIAVKPNVAELTGKGVRFGDGSVEEIDAITYATGYNILFPFLDRSVVEVNDNHVALFKRIWKPGIPNLFFMGLAQPLPTLVNFAEQQAKWVLAHLAGECALPSTAEMEETIRRDEARNIGSHYKSRRHTQQLNFDIYCAEIKREMARGRARVAKAAA